MLTDKNRLLEQIGQVFIRRGYDGATLVHLAQATGLSKATLYHHFPNGKPEMAVALVRHAIVRLQKLAFSHFQSTSTIKAWPLFIDGFSAYVEQGRSNCVLAVLAHQSTAHEEIAPLQLQINQQFNDWHQTLCNAIEATGVTPKKAKRTAHQTMAQIYGALMVSKLHNNDKLFPRTISRLRKQFSHPQV